MCMCTYCVIEYMYCAMWSRKYMYMYVYLRVPVCKWFLCKHIVCSKVDVQTFGNLWNALAVTLYNHSFLTFDCSHLLPALIERSAI